MPTSPAINRLTHTFYTVQDEADRRRVAGGGDPWPSGLPRALLGRGLYCWADRHQAESYRNRLISRGVAVVAVLQLMIDGAVCDGLATLDLTVKTDAEQESWMDEYSEYTSVPPRKPHGFDHVIRETYNVGREHYFSPAAFTRFRIVSSSGR